MMHSHRHQAFEIHSHAMPEDYQLHPYDVLNGRGKMAFNYVGNRRFRVTLALALPKYQTISNRQEKSALIISIAQLVRQNGGHFLTRSNGKWIEIGDKAAREKVGHALRDMVGHNVAKAKKQITEKERAPSPSCVLQDPNEDLQDPNDDLSDPLDMSSADIFPDQYIQALCHAFSNDDVVEVIDV